MLEHSTPNNRRTLCMLVTSDMVSDPRVARHAETLGSHGFRVLVICPISSRTEPHESRPAYEILRPRRSRALNAILSTLTTKRNMSIARSSTKLPREQSYPWTRLITTAGSFLLTQLALLRAAKKQRAQVYCANDFDTLLVTILAAGLDRLVVYDSHELWPDMMLAPEPIKAIARAVEKVLIRRANLVMTVNEFIATELKHRYSLTRVPDVVYNCPNSGLRPKRRNDSPRVKVALYQGLYAPERGLENLIKAADYLLADIHLVLRGYGVIENELRSLAKGRKNVQFAKPVAMNQLVNAAADAHVGLIPYLPTNLCNYLASPNKLFEYIQAGLPIVASDLPFLRKVVLGNDIGALFDAREPQSIANALNKSTRDPTFRRQRSNLASVAAKYSWEIESKKLLKAYASLVQVAK